MMTALSEPNAPSLPAGRMFRIEIHPRADQPDPLAQSVLAQVQALCPGVAAVRTARVYLIEAPLTDEQARQVADDLLADPVTQEPVIGSAPVADNAVLLEVHYQPGVMDPVAQSTRAAIGEMFPDLPVDQTEVRTGFRYDLALTDQAQAASHQTQLRAFAERYLANTVIQDIHAAPFCPERFPRGSAYHLRLTHVPIRDLDDAALTKMSREAHLFLSLDEMRAIRDHFQTLDREPTDIELETLAQTWSEHCVHKTLKSTVRYYESPPRHVGPGQAPFGRWRLDWQNRPGHTVNPDGSVTIANLLKSTIAAATNKLMEEAHFGGPAGAASGGGGWCISVFKDNAGIVRFDDTDAVCIKVETHNHPSAIEPYGGAATGIGGCIRDVMGTGLAARPIANTDVFCVAPPPPPPEGGSPESIPKGVVHPQRILQQVVAGVRDYGNRMGIPTVNGAVYFHPDFLGNPLVYCGCIGLIPLDKCFGRALPGDHIIALGGATGRDGIHGATFSSAELTDTHAAEFSHAVQIGNAITQKKTLDVILQARDPRNADGSIAAPLFHGLTDCGAGGFSSAVGEMGKDLGAVVHLDRAPLKYQGLSYTEIWISEAQERMVLAVPPENLAKLQALCAAEDVDYCDLGEFGHGPAEQPELALFHHDTQVGQMSMHFLHEGIPTPTREATWPPAPAPAAPSATSSHPPSTIPDILRALLAHPNIASKHWIIRQYDHEVQGGSVIKPLVGPGQDGPSDAAVLRPKLTTNRGIALSCGLQPGLSEKTPGGDSYWATLAALDEAVRNLICVGADPEHIAVLDNFCWPSCTDPAQLGSLVRAAAACYDGALAYRTPFVSGKDSLNNQFTTEDGQVITIPQTLLITALGIVPDVMRCRTMDAKAPGNLLLIVGPTTTALGGAHYQMLTGDDSRDRCIPQVDLKLGPATARAIAGLITQGLVQSAHDCSDGGLLVAAAEMAFAGRIGLDLDLDGLPAARELDDLTACFAETPSRYFLEIAPQNLDAVARALRQAGIPFGQLGAFASHHRLTVRCAKHGRLADVALDDLRQTWLKPLDW